MNDTECENDGELNNVEKIEEILHTADYVTTLNLDGDEFSLIGNTETEASIIS